jgi:hypothetical protein
VTSPQPRVVGSVGGEEGSQARRRRSLVGKESCGEGLRRGRRDLHVIEEEPRSRSRTLHLALSYFLSTTAKRSIFTLFH